MAYNPNFGLPGMLRPPPQPHMNRNPLGSGGNLGLFQPQSIYPDQTMNSTQYSPAQYGDLSSDNQPPIPSLWEDILSEQQKQNSAYKQILQSTLGQAGLRSQGLLYARQLEEQARRSAPTSGTYWFIGGL